eukprot:1797336-Rhodomonas_salina.1
MGCTRPRAEAVGSEPVHGERGRRFEGAGVAFRGGRESSEGGSAEREAVGQRGTGASGEGLLAAWSSSLSLSLTHSLTHLFTHARTHSLSHALTPHARVWRCGPLYTHAHTHTYGAEGKGVATPGGAARDGAARKRSKPPHLLC